jgi:hypothetical protein
MMQMHHVERFTAICAPTTIKPWNSNASRNGMKFASRTTRANAPTNGECQMQARAAVFGAIMAMAIAAPANATVPVTGTGTVDFRFTSFYGPFQVATASGVPSFSGTVNGATPTQFLTSNPTGRPDNSTFTTGLIGFGSTTFPVAGTPTTSIVLNDGFAAPGSVDENIISFAPAAFTNVPLATPFKLGTVTFQNGGWYGGGASAALNVPTRMGFRISTVSSSGPKFNNTRNYALIMTVNAPFPNDTTILAGQEAEADWITLYDTDNGITLNSFRVFDQCCKPGGETNSGSVDLMGVFGSLTLTGFANPVGGFITESSLPLPPVEPPPPPPPPPPAIPEPASWAMLIAGFGLVGAVQRRRRATGPDKGSRAQPV